MASTSTSTASQPVIFKTQTQYPLPSQKFFIPTTWKRYQLSQLINKALLLLVPVPFDFIVRGEILRSTLGEWCAEKGVGEEEILEIEYIESVMPPQKMADFPHEHWVSSVASKLRGHFITASYDGGIRIFDSSKNLIINTPTHAAPATSVCVIPKPADASDTHLLASASHDLTAHLTQITMPTETQSDAHARSTLLATLHLHTQPLSSICANSTGTHLLTSSWDTLIGLWDTTIPSVDEVAEDVVNNRKRRKIDSDVRARRKAPRSVLKSHSARVSGVAFTPRAESTAVSAGFDSTVRTWDVESGVCTRTITSSEKPFFGLALIPDGNSVVATSSDRTMTLFDLRNENIASASASFPHPALPSCVAAGRDMHTVVTGAYDGVVRVWDLRSTKSAVASLKAWDGSKKVLSVDWEMNNTMAVGGEGGLEVWKVPTNTN